MPDLRTRRYQRMVRRAEAAGYPGDIADLLAEDEERHAESLRAERERANNNLEKAS